MINYRLNAWEVNDLWAVDIYANGDFLETLHEYATKEEAEKIGQAFIDGIKFARGEE